MYKWLVTNALIQRSEDNACIPADSANADYRKVLDWVAQGNTIQAADPAPAPPDLADINNLDKALKALGLLTRQYCNAIAANTYATKTVADTRSDFMTIYRAL